MQLPKTKAREIIFLILYSLHFSKDKEEGMERFIADELKVGVRHIHEVMPKVDNILSEVGYIDAKVEAYATEYKVKRIPKVELNIIRLALFEIYFDDEVPTQVAIAEGIRLARKFGNEESFKFVNAVLDYLKLKVVAKSTG